MSFLGCFWNIEHFQQFSDGWLCHKKWWSQFRRYWSSNETIWNEVFDRSTIFQRNWRLLGKLTSSLFLATRSRVLGWFQILWKSWIERWNFHWLSSHFPQNPVSGSLIFPQLFLTSDPPPKDETWTNKACRPGNSTYTVVNAKCYQGICQCNPGYFASMKKDFCHYCPSPKIWNHFEQKCEEVNDAGTNCNPFNFSCTNKDLIVNNLIEKHLIVLKLR